MNLGGSFSLKVSRSGVEVMFLGILQVAFCTSERLYSLVHCLSRPYHENYSVDADQAFAVVVILTSTLFWYCA